MDQFLLALVWRSVNGIVVVAVVLVTSTKSKNLNRVQLVPRLMTFLGSAILVYIHVNSCLTSPPATTGEESQVMLIIIAVGSAIRTAAYLQKSVIKALVVNLSQPSG